jgi:hypothetical protein
MKTRARNRISRIRWKKKDNFAIFIIIFVGSMLALVGLSYNKFYDIFFSTCVGLFFGGIVLSVISTFLAQMESNITGAGELDADTDIDAEVDVDVDTDIDAEVDMDIDAEVDVDIDTDIGIDMDADIDVDADVDIDYDMGAEVEIDAVEVEVEVDVEAEVDVDSDIDVDIEADIEIDTDIISTITPAPIMLLFSSAFLIFGISGILLYQLIDGVIRFIILFIAPLAAYLTAKIINYSWKVIAKSRFYRISSTQNLIGIQGEVLLPVDERGGIIKITSSTPMRFEKLHVKPAIVTSHFERGDKVYICDVKDGFLLVDNNKKSIKRRK